MPIKALMITVTLCCATVSTAQANAEAAACMAKLSADGQLIVNTVSSELVPTTDLRTLVRAKTVQLAGEGKISQAAAPDAALAAAECLELLRQ